MPVIVYLVSSIVVLLISFCINNYIKNKRFWKCINEFPGQKTLPLLGNSHQFGTTSEEIFEKSLQMFENLGKQTFKVVMGHDAYVCLFDPENIEIVLGSTKELTKLQDYDFLRDWLGDGLLMSTGDKWRRQRKIITPTFHFKILEKFIDVFNDKGEILLKKLAPHTEEIFDIYPLVTLYALDVISESAMGVCVNAQQCSSSEYVKAIYRMCEIVNTRAYSLIKRINFFFAFTADYKDQKKALSILHGFTNGVIKSRRKLLKDEIDRKMRDGVMELDAEDVAIGKKRTVAFLDLLLLSKTAEGGPLSDQVIREEVDTFMFEGHDTTSRAISFALYSLSNWPRVQEKALTEQREIMGDDPYKPVTYNDLQKMKYLECVIRETLRLYPSVPMFGRKLINDVVLPDGRIIPGGANVLILLMALGKSEKYFDEPEKFNPDRYLADNLRNKHPFLNSTFSAGPRNCIGQKFAMLEIKSVLSKIIRSFELFASGKPVKEVPEITLTSKTGFHVQMRKIMY